MIVLVFYLLLELLDLLFKAVELSAVTDVGILVEEERRGGLFPVQGCR